MIVVKIFYLRNSLTMQKGQQPQEQYNTQLLGALFDLSPQNLSLKRFFIFFVKKTCSEKVSYIFSKKSFSNFQETELSYIFLKIFFSYISGKVEAYSETWYIQNPSHIQNTVKHLKWNILQKQLPSASFKPKLEK